MGSTELTVREVRHHRVCRWPPESPVRTMRNIVVLTSTTRLPGFVKSDKDHREYGQCALPVMY